jgi:hypothetical protein
MIQHRIVAYLTTDSMGDATLATISDPLDQSIVDAAAQAAVAYLPTTAGQPMDLSGYSGVRVVRTEQVDTVTADYPVEV